MMHIEDGEDPPDICVPPPINPALTRYVEAFFMLQSDRQIGMAAGPIPTAAIIAYAKEVEGVTERRDLKRFLRFVRAIDSEWLQAQHREKPDDDGNARHRGQNRH